MTARWPVKIYWYPRSERGRKSVPDGPSYFGVFQPNSPDLGTESWSVLIEQSVPAGHIHWRDAMLSFVSEEAPVGSLRPGHAFTLFEGRWPVAEGVVVQGDRFEGVAAAAPSPG